MNGQVAQDRLGLRCPGGVITPAQHRLRAGFVQRRDEHRGARFGIGGHQPLARAATQSGDGQPGERLGKGGHIGLRIARPHPQRVQLQDLARQIFVETR